ncbi:MAG: hypothetical protein PVI26_10520 [Chitinispirillia bacterium]|jgi:hypothetical protein
MRPLVLFITSVAFLFSVYADKTSKDTEQKDSVESQIIAGIYIGSGKLFNSNAQNNLDWLFGNVYLGTEYKHNNLSGAIVLAAFPEGLGPPPWFNASLSPYDSAKDTKDQIVKINIWKAYMYLNTEIIDFKFGRWILSKGVGRFYGFYSGTPYKAVRWWSVGSMRNQFELSKTVRSFHASASISPDDKNFKKGKIHVLLRYSLKDIINFSYSYGANVFDRINNKDAIINNNIDICIDATPVPKLKDFMVFADMGFVDITDNESVEIKYPFSFGFTVPTNKVMNLVQVEMEVLADRKWIDHDQKEKDATFLFGIHFNKEFLNHFNIEGALYSNGSPENITVEIGLDSRF